jgi:hypothetical protein
VILGKTRQNGAARRSLYLLARRAEGRRAAYEVMTMESKSMKAVFTVVERGPGKSYWTRIGVGFVNQDGSMNLRLDALPVNGTLQVRDWEPYERREGGGDFPPRRAPGEGAAPRNGAWSAPGDTPALPVSDPPRGRRGDALA